MTPAPNWAAVVVNFESGSLLVDCVRSLFADDSAGAPEVVAMPRLAAVAYPRLRSGSTTATSGNAPRSVATDPSREPLSTTTTSTVPAESSARSASTQSARRPPDS